MTGITVFNAQNCGIHQSGITVLCFRNDGSESSGILTYDTEIWDNREKYNCTDEEFQEKYGEPVFYDNEYDSQGMINELRKVQDKISDDSFRSDFENLIQLVQKMSETHDAEYVYDAFEILHDMYYYLFNYGPELALISGEREQTMTYYGVLNEKKEKFVLEEK